jgi:hypothetical protein
LVLSKPPLAQLVNYLYLDGAEVVVDWNEEFLIENQAHSFLDDCCRPLLLRGAGLAANFLQFLCSAREHNIGVARDPHVHVLTLSFPLKVGYFLYLKKELSDRIPDCLVNLLPNATLMLGICKRSCLWCEHGIFKDLLLHLLQEVKVAVFLQVTQLLVEL